MKKGGRIIHSSTMQSAKYTFLVIIFIQLYLNGAVDGQCQTVFRKYDGTNAQGGIQQVPKINYNSADKCKKKCISTPNCVALDYDRVVNECFLFLNPNGQPPAQGINEDVEHYVLTADCNKCTNGFEEKPATYSTQGEFQAAEVNSAELCREVCRKRTDCVSVDFNIVNKACFVHNREKPELKSPNVNKYYKKICDGDINCYQGYAKFEKSASGKGNLQLIIINTLQKCRDKCQEFTSCAAFEFNRISKTCYTFTANQTLAYSNNVDHYVKTGCQSSGAPATPGPGVTTTAINIATTTGVGSVCEHTFTERPNSNAAGGSTQAANLNTADLCKTACRQDPQCQALDFKSSRCWFHATVPTTPGFAAGSTQYVKNKCGDCIEGFTEYTKARVLGPSVEQPEFIDTFVECRTACMKTDQCTGFDMVNLAVGISTRRCYLFSVNAVLLRVATNELSTHYRRNNCGQPSTPTTEKPAPTGICIAGFTSYTSVQGSGNSVIQTDKRTPGSCREECRRIISCTGFNYHIPTRECRTFTLTKIDLIENSDYVFERNSRCVEASTSPGGTTMIPFQCIPVFAQRPNTFAIGGIHVPSATSIPACMSACSIDDKCVALDATPGGGCFVHRKYPTSQVGNGVNQYIKTPCLGCDDGFSVFEGVRSIGGRDEDFKTVESCRMRCLQFSTCVGFEFNKVTDQCTRYTAAVGNLFFDENVVHYRKSSCSGCLDGFNKNAKKNMFNGVIQENARSELACRAYCLSKPYLECLAYDWDRVRNECFTHSSVDPTGTNNNVDHFRRQQCSETTTLDPSVTGKPLSCPVSQYTLIPGKMSPSGTPQSKDKNTVDRCMAVCDELENCAAMDFSTALKTCWIFTRIVTEVVTSNGVDHYTKQPCRPCEDGYTLYQDERGNGGDRQPGFFTLISCRTVCERQFTCSAFDYSRVDKECYLFFTQLDTLSSTSSVGNDHYRKTNCQQCIDRFDEIAGLVSNVNAHTVDVSNSRQCQEVCRRIPDCHAGDFRNQDGKCIIHTNINDLQDADLIEHPRVTHFRRVPCNLDLFMTTTETSCSRQFNQEIDTTYTSGGRFQKIGASTSREACERACRFEVSCVAYEWNRRKLVCWLHYTSSDLVSAQRESSPNTDHFRKSEKCSSSTEPQAVVGGASGKFSQASLLVMIFVASSAYLTSSLQTP